MINDCDNYYWNQYETNDEDFDYNNNKTDIKPNINQKNEDLKLIKTIEKEENLFRLITSSFCPQIYGNELLKSALVLSLFCGTDKYDKEYKNMKIRDRIHILIIGNHGTGKDLLLKSVNSIAYKSQYICGNTSTLNILTPYLPKEKGKQIIRKGSLVSAHNGFCCIDEFDKMDGLQHQALQEVMQFMTFSVIKRGIVHKLKARTGMIAAANPISGFYNDSKNVWENIKVNKSVISKFDLIFVLHDSPDKELDSKLSEEVLVSRRNDRSNIQNSESSKSLSSNNKCLGSQSVNSLRNDCNLMSKLIYGPEEEEPDLIPHELLKKYVTYAHQYIHPVISSEARTLLNEFSLEIAKTKISKSKTRNLELLYRLAESRAKLELRSIVTKEDAFDVIDILKHSIDFQQLIVGISQPINSMFGSTKKAKALNLIKALKIIEEQTQQNVFSVNEITEICSQFKLPFNGKEDIMATMTD